MASVVEAPEILVYDRSRKAAERQGCKEDFRKAQIHTRIRGIRWLSQKVVTIEMEYDEKAKAFVTYVGGASSDIHVSENGIRGAGQHSREIRGYIKSMEANGKRIPLAASKLSEL